MTQQFITHFEQVRILFKNFKGESHPKYNRDGFRTFHMALDWELAEELREQGFNIRYPKPNPEINPDDDKRLPTLEVVVTRDHNYINPSVKIHLVDESTDSVRRIPNDDLVQIGKLDEWMLGPCDIVISPYEWVMDEGTPHETRGVKAYLSVLYAPLRNDAIEDPFASKYGLNNM